MTDLRYDLEDDVRLQEDHSAGRNWVSPALVVLALLVGVGLAYLSVNVSFGLSLGVLAALILGAVVIRNPETGLLLLIFAIPLEDFNRLGQVGSLSPIKLMGVAMLGAYIIHYLVFQRNERLVYVPQNIFLALFFMAVLASDLIAIDPAYAVDKTYKLLRMVVFYFLVVNIIRSEASLKRVFWVMIWAGILSAGYGLYEYYFLPGSLDDMRISGTLDDPTGFAYTMVILLPLVWYLLTHTRRPLMRLGLAAAGMLFLYAILLSGTRSAMLAAVGVMFLIAVQAKRPLLTLTIAALILLLALVFMPEQTKSRLGISSIETSKAAQASTERRITYLMFGTQLFLEYPFLGTGLGGFATEYGHSEYQFMRLSGEARRIAHNMYLEIAIGTGLTGLLPFLLLMGSPLIGLQKVTSRARYGLAADMAKMVQISLLAYLFVGFFSSSQYDKTLWLLVGLASLLPVVARNYAEMASAEAEGG